MRVASFFAQLCVGAVLLSGLARPFELEHTHGIIFSCRKCLKRSYPEVAKFIDFDYKHYNDLTVSFSEETLHPYLETRSVDGQTVSMYDISTLTLENIRLLLAQLHFSLRQPLQEPIDVHDEFEGVPQAHPGDPAESAGPRRRRRALPRVPRTRPVATRA